MTGGCILARTSLQKVSDSSGLYRKSPYPQLGSHAGAVKASGRRWQKGFKLGANTVLA